MSQIDIHITLDCNDTGAARKAAHQLQQILGNLSNMPAVNTRAPQGKSTTAVDDQHAPAPDADAEDAQEPEEKPTPASKKKATKKKASKKKAAKKAESSEDDEAKAKAEEEKKAANAKNDGISVDELRETARKVMSAFDADTIRALIEDHNCQNISEVHAKGKSADFLADCEAKLAEA